MSTVERKTTFATLFTYLVSLGALGVLNWTTTANLIAGMPDWLEALIAPLVPALTTLLVGYNVAHRPDQLSPSAINAARRRGVEPGRVSGL